MTSTEDVFREVLSGFAVMFFLILFSEEDCAKVPAANKNARKKTEIFSNRLIDFASPE